MKKKTYKLQWHTFAGGTSAAPGKNSYQSTQTDMGQYNVDPVSWENGRHRYYVTHFVNNRGKRTGGLWQQIHTGDLRTGKRIAREHFDRISRDLEPVSEMHKRTNIERLPNPAKKFTAKQLNTLREKFAGIDKIDPASPTYQTLIAAIDLYTQPMLKQLATADIKFLSKLARNRIKRGKNPVTKKRRTAKQKAATKKLVAFNKKRRGRKIASPATRKRRATSIARHKARHKPKRNPKRTSLKKSHLWMAFVCWPKGKVTYAYISDTHTPRVGISENKGQSVLFKTKTRAHNVAKLLAKIWPGAIAGVANADATAAEIRAACGGKA